MNKIVSLNTRQDNSKFHYSKLKCSEDVGRLEYFDDILFCKYGIECIDNSFDYRVTDESKFTIFMLTRSQYIRNVSYE
jgi:hypothetical protein